MKASILAAPASGAPLQIEIPATPEQVGFARRQVSDWTRGLAWGEDDVDTLVLAVGEACNNAVSYGGQAFAAPRMSISCRQINAKQLQIDVCNQGNGFHPEMSRLAQMPAAEEFATHGRGFALMSVLVDDVQVLSDGKDTTVRLTKSRSV